MIRQIAIVLGVGALLTTAASLIQIEPVNAQQSKQRVQTRAGNSLSNLESRSISKDPEVFFPESSQRTTPKYPEGASDNSSQSESRFELMGEEFIFKQGETVSSDDDFDSFYRNEAQSDKVRVLMTVDEWNN